MAIETGFPCIPTTFKVSEGEEVGRGGGGLFERGACLTMARGGGHLFGGGRLSERGRLFNYGLGGGR